MPELPEVETVRRGLAAALEGRRVVRVVARRPDLRLPLPPDLAARVEGRRVTRVGRRGKYLLLHLGGGRVLIAHLGMSGRMAVINGSAEGSVGPPGPHDHVSIFAEGAAGEVEVRFTDARRFGLLALAAEATLDRHPLLRALGPEPLADGFDGAALAAALKGRKTPIKAALLDQRTVAGLGNIYASEALFRARLSPRRRAATVQGRRAGRLAAAIRAVLAEAIEAGGSSLRDYVRTTGELGYFQHRWAVYGREGLPCPGCDCAAAGGGIRRIVQSGRATFYCPKRQR